MDVLTKEQRRKNMQAIHSKDTKIEILLGRALWKAGYRYRKNDKLVLGKPDFTFKSYKLAVFCDSEFWHGKDWKNQQKRIGTNKEFWIIKIQNNINRDKRVNRELKKHGWTVLRFWGPDIKKNLNKCLKKIETKIISLKQAPCSNLETLQ
jgi:DNA mismatch endonuclease (patch repair protein)